MWLSGLTGRERERERKEFGSMRKATQSLKLFVAEWATARNVRVAVVILTLATVIISAAAPISPGGPN
jgi:hypothetical protein